MPPRNDVTGPNTYNPQTTVPIEQPVQTGGVWQAITDSYRMGWMGQVAGSINREAQAWTPATPGFDAKAHIPVGYESYAPFFQGAMNQGEIDLRKSQIDANIAARERRDARGGWSTFGTDMATGLVDPINLFAPELRGLGFVRGAAKGAMTLGAAGAAAEGIRGSLDPTSTRAETISSMMTSVAGGALMGGAMGHFLKGAPSAAAMTRPVRPVIDVGNENALQATYEHIIRPQESSSGQNLVGKPTFDGKKMVQALGAGQVTEDTGKAVAKQLGIKWDPARMTSHAPEDIAYQDQIGLGAWSNAVKTAHGDLETAFKVYYGGPNPKSWGPKTLEYAREQMARLGYTSEGGAITRPATAVGAINALEGMEMPSHVEVDGRWLPVVDGPLPNGGLAARVPAKSAGELAGDAEHAAALTDAGGEQVMGRVGSDASPFDGLGKIASNQVRDVAASFDRRMDSDPALKAAIEQRIGPNPDRGMIEQLVADERWNQIRQDMQAKADAGEITPSKEQVVAGDTPEVSRRRALQGRIEQLQKRIDGLTARILQHDKPDRPYMVPKEMVRDKESGQLVPKNWQKATTAANALTRQQKALQAELDALGGNPNVDVAGGELFAPDVAGFDQRLAHEFEALQGRNAGAIDNYDTDLAELRALDAQKRGNDMSTGELADELPFGMEHDGNSYFETDGEHIRIDTQAIFASFRDKPWTAPRIEGVAPFPEDAFRSPDEWLEFVVAHEIEHSVNPAKPGEALPDYENRINAQAYERVMASRAPGGALENRLRRIAMMGTPQSALERLVPDKGAEIHRSMQLLASDMAMMLAGNRLGFTPLRGGSVFQRVERWRVKPMAELQDALRRGYLEELGLSPEGTRAGVELRVLAQGPRNLASKAMGAVGKGDGALRKTLDEFKSDVAAAVTGFRGELNGRTIDPSPAAEKVAAKIREINAEFEKAAREVNLFGKTKELSRLYDGASRNAAEFRTKAGNFRKAGNESAADDMEALAAEAQARADDFKKQLDEPIMQPGEKQYFHRLYSQHALNENKDLALEALENAYRRTGHPNPRMAAQGAFDTLTLDPESTDFFGPGAPRGIKKVDLPWSNAEAFPFLVHDPEAVFGIYARRMGSAIEMTRTFGDAWGLDHIDRLKADLIERGVPAKKIERAMQLFEDARDHVNGGFYNRSPLAWDFRATRLLKNTGNLAVLGKGVYSQVADLARFVVVQGLGVKRLVTGEGPGGLIGAILGAFAGDISKFNPGGIAKLAGEAGELVSARIGAVTMDADAAIYANRDSFIERALAKANVPFFMLNLMTPWTIFWKELSGMVAAHTIIDEAKQIASHVHGGGTLETAPKAIRGMYERLAQNGIDPQMAQLIASMPTEEGAHGLHLPNVMAWEGDKGQEARSALLAAVNGEIRRSVPTPGVLERPRIFDGAFYSASGRAEQQAKIDSLKEQLQAATDKDEAAMLRSELDAARRDMGRAGRVQLPLLSLPFQLHVFAMTAGPKILYGLLSNSERQRFGSILSLLLAGATVTYLKAHDPIGGLTTSSWKQRKQATAWDKMTWGEMAWSSWEYSNLGGIFTDVAKNITTLSRAAGHDPSFGVIPNVDPGDNSLRDEIGSSLGVAPALVAGLVEPFVTNDPNDSKAEAIRRIVPFNNLIWWKGAVDRVSDALSSSNGANASVATIPTPAPNAGMSVFGRANDHAFFAPDPETLKPFFGEQAMRELAPITPAGFDLSNPPPLRKEKGSRRARIAKPSLFGESSGTPAVGTAAPTVGDTLPPLRRGRGARRARVIKPSLF